MKFIALAFSFLCFASVASAQDLQCVAGAQTLTLSKPTKKITNKIFYASWASSPVYDFSNASCELVSEEVTSVRFHCYLEPEWQYQESVAEVVLSKDGTSAIAYALKSDRRFTTGYQMIGPIPMECSPYTPAAQ